MLRDGDQVRVMNFVLTRIAGVWRSSWEGQHDWTDEQVMEHLNPNRRGTNYFGLDIKYTPMKETDMGEPITLPSDPRWGIEQLLAAATGKLTDVGEIGHGAIHVVAYGWSLYHTHPGPNPMLHGHAPAAFVAAGPDDLAGCLSEFEETVHGHYTFQSGGVGAVDWSAIIMQLIPVALRILELLSKKEQA